MPAWLTARRGAAQSITHNETSVDPECERILMLRQIVRSPLHGKVERSEGGDVPFRARRSGLTGAMGGVWVALPQMFFPSCVIICRSLSPQQMQMYMQLGAATCMLLPFISDFDPILRPVSP